MVENQVVVDDPDTGDNEAEGCRAGHLHRLTDQDDTDAVNDDPVTLTLELGGEDAAAFKLTDDDTGKWHARQWLSTSSGSRRRRTTSRRRTNGDNKYKVSIVAKDDDGLTSMTELTIEVMNVDEPGMVMLDQRQPAIGRPVTATLTDEDGGITGAKWQWYATLTKPRDTLTDQDDDTFKIRRPT